MVYYFSVSTIVDLLKGRGADLCWAFRGGGGGGGVICKFYPILNIGGWSSPTFSRKSNMTNVQHAFEQIKWKPKNKNGLSSPKLEDFVPKIRWRPKKKGGGMQSNYWGDTSPQVLAPLLKGDTGQMSPMPFFLIQTYWDPQVFCN